MSNVTLLDSTMEMICTLLETSETRSKIRLVRNIKKNRKKIYKAFNEDGIVTEDEKTMLKDLDHAWVNATIKLGNF